MEELKSKGKQSGSAVRAVHLSTEPVFQSQQGPDGLDELGRGS